MSGNLFTGKMLIKTLPFTALFCLVKYGLHLLPWQGWPFNSLSGALFGGTTFLLALILNETLKDYRSCETMPGELAHSLLIISDYNSLLSIQFVEYSPWQLQEALPKIAALISSWLNNKTAIGDIFTEIDQLTPLIAKTIPWGGISGAIRMQAEQSKIRKLVTQIKNNRDLIFLPEAYTLLAIFLVSSLLVLLLNNTDQFLQNIILSGFIFTSFMYLMLLIIDLDNPFQYNGKSSIDVNLTVLTEVEQSLRLSLPQSLQTPEN